MGTPYRRFDLRKLAAIDVLFIGPKLIVAEYAAAVFLSPALGILSCIRSRSAWQTALGVYLICLGLNYVPMLWHAIGITRRRSAEVELAGEPDDKSRAMGKYRRLSLILLVPLLAPALEILHAISKPPSK